MTSSEKISQGISLFAEGFGEMFREVAKQFTEAWKNVYPVLSSVSKHYNKTMKKKRFMKLLQSYGIQRNEINKIVKNNKEPYTYRRLLETINLYKKEGN